jgi:predicted nucleic acid-binding Zn ribbon protein
MSQRRTKVEVATTVHEQQRRRSRTTPIVLAAAWVLLLALPAIDHVCSATIPRDISLCAAELADRGEAGTECECPDENVTECDYNCTVLNGGKVRVRALFYTSFTSFAS